MPVLEIGGRRIEVGDAFLRLPADQQQAQVDEIARSLGGSTPTVPSPSASAGSILPFSRDAQGNTQFDMTAGIPGMIGRMATLPGDVATGRMPVFTPEGQFNPDFLRRSAELAAGASPANPAMRAGERMIPGEALASREMGMFRPTPNAAELKATGGAQLNAAKAAPLDIDGAVPVNMATDLQQQLFRDGFVVEDAPKTFARLNSLTKQPQGGFTTISAMEAARRRFMDDAIKGGSEGEAARRAVRAIDDLFGSLGPQNTMARTPPAYPPSLPGTAQAVDPAEVTRTLQEGRANYAAAMRSNELTGELDKGVGGILDRAQARAEANNSGRNFGNNLRQEILKFLSKDENVAGLTKDEVASLRAELQGSTAANLTRTVGNLLGGGGGLGQALTSGVGGILAGWPGMAAGLTAGPTLRAAGNAMARSGIGGVDEMLRQRSPLAQGLRSTYAPSLNRNDAILRALLPGLLAPQQPVVPGLLQDPRRLGPLA